MTTKGQKLWEKAKKIIPGGNQLISKRSHRFLPDLWPSYYSKAKGCEIWDLDGTHYYDFAGMGIGCCILGYADNEVNSAAIKAINDGSATTLNCYEEVKLAEKLIEINNWADMVRFSRGGGEACAIAVRIARAATGRSKVAFCGYHGWHDWYIAANLSGTSTLDEHLLEGLSPAGVPKELKNTTFPFNFNKINELESIIDRHGDEIGVIIMEPERNFPPEKGFLEKIREYADKIGAVLIFDEITSGFRMNIGGLHQIYNIFPDIAVYGKGLGNGFPISAIVGRKEVMDAAQTSFISSTFWTERVGFTAALATLEKMEKENIPNYLISYGKQINEGWKKISHKHGIELEIGGIPPLTHFSFKADNNYEMQTLYNQEMLKKGFLCGPMVYVSFAYSEELIKKFIEYSDEAFAVVKKAINSGNIGKFLESKPLTPGFIRLN